VILALVCLGMGLGDLYGIGSSPIAKGAFRMAVHGGPCLAAVALVSAGPAALRASAALLALAPAAWRFLGPDSLKAHPGVLIGVMVAAAVATRLSVGPVAWREAG
jgi:hypothetical protein